MGLFSRKKKPPRWARPLETVERYERFVEIAVETLGDRDPPIEQWQVRSGSIILSGTEVALDDAVERCAEVDEDSWGEILAAIAAEADSDLAHNAEPERISETEVAIGDRTIDLVEGDFADIAPFLRIEVLSPESLEDLELDAMVTREVGGDLTAALVFDFGSFDQTVEAEHAAGWEPDTDEIWRVALENLVADPLAVQTFETPGGDVVMLAGDGNFVSALALRWRDVWARVGAAAGDEAAGDEPAEVEAPHGALLALPSSHALLVHVLDPETSLEAIEPMLELATQLHGELEDPIAPELFWQPEPDAPLEPLEIDDELAITDPEALVDLLGGTA